MPVMSVCRDFACKYFLTQDVQVKTKLRIVEAFPFHGTHNEPLNDAGYHFDKFLLYVLTHLLLKVCSYFLSCINKSLITILNSGLHNPSKRRLRRTFL